MSESAAPNTSAASATPKIRVAVVFGGRSSEHAISCVTAGSVLKVLDPELGAILGVERFLSEIRVTANLQHPDVWLADESGPPR